MVDRFTTAPLELPPAEAPFARADLIFYGLDHSGASFEARVFIDQRRVGGEADSGHRAYVGSFFILGHGGCFGDVGHCDVPPPSSDPTDLRPAHPLTPLDTYVTVTAALRRLLAAGAALESVTLVPIALPPRRQDRAPAAGLFHFQSVDLRTYLTPADQPAI